ncbi:MAG TPA: glycosyltransferase family 4 protein [Actinomycetota bacterium]|nr:glycosyltransferase family 4 protein [Actinomycetota bacterium]
MRILTTADRLSLRGGLERVHLEVNRSLAQRGHVIDLLYSAPGEATDSWFSFVRRSAPVRCVARRQLRGAPSLVGTLIRAAAFGARSRPDVIYSPRHTHLVHALTVGAVSRAPVVCHLHSPPPRAQLTRAQRVVLGRVRRFVAVSNFTAAQWVSAGIPEDRVSVVHNGVDIRRFQPLTEGELGATRRQLGIDPATRVVLYAGRLDPRKGIDVLLEAWKLLSTELDGARLVVAGAPSEYLGERGDALLEGWRHRCDPATTVLLGHTPDPIAVYEAADLVVVPSVWTDPFPLAVLEAMAVGVPVVASRVGGIPEALGARFRSHLVEPGRPAELAAKVRELIDWRTRSPRLGHACRDHVLTHFTLDRMVERLEALFVRAVLHHKSMASTFEPRRGSNTRQ